jgi:hypothetical protein
MQSALVCGQRFVPASPYVIIRKVPKLIKSLGEFLFPPLMMSDTRVAVRPYVIGPTHTSFQVPAGGGGGTAVFDASGGDGAFGNISWNHTTSASATGMIVLVTAYIPGGSPPTVTYNAVPMTQDATTVTWTANPMTLYVFSLPSPSSGTNSVAITANGAAGVLGTSVTVTGGSISPVIRAGSVSGTSGTSNAPTTNCTTATNDLVMSHVNNGAGGGAITYTATTGTEKQDFSISGASSACSVKTATGASEAMSWTVDGGGSPNWGIMVASFQHA